MLCHPDQFGFYRVGGFRSYSKMEAIELHTKSGIHPHWDFNESVYSLYDWTKEPTQSLEELYRLRAQQIRDRYDYVVLWYSSGADSDAVMHTFLDNDIPLDELASFVNYEGNGDKHDLYNNGEIYDIAAQRAQAYQVKYPDLKYRLVDMCQPIVDFWSKKDTMFDWKYSQNTIFNPNATIRGRLSQTVEDWKRITDSGKTIAFIWGIDKPRLNLIDGKYCFQFTDIVDNSVNPAWQRNPPPGEHMEFFFWTPNMPEIMIKQAHVLKKYLRAATSQSPFMEKKSSGLGFIVENGCRHWISATGVNCLIYPKFEYHYLNDWKPPALFFTPRDQWFFSLPAHEIARERWKNSLTELWSSVPDYWKNNPDDINKAFKSCVSRPYFLE